MDVVGGRGAGDLLEVVEGIGEEGCDSGFKGEEMEVAARLASPPKIFRFAEPVFAPIAR
jgi:hypothetical protein